MSKCIEKYIDMMMGIVKNDYPTINLIVMGHKIVFQSEKKTIIGSISVFSNGDNIIVMFKGKQYFNVNINDDEISDAIIEPLNWLLL